VKASQSKNKRGENMGGNKYDEAVKPSEVPPTSSEKTQQTQDPPQPETSKIDADEKQPAA
jgi:hypothetical protein